MTFSAADLSTLNDILIAAARQEVLPRFRNLAEDAVRQKTSATDLVTDADEAAERVITAALARAFPGALVVGEEATSADPALLGRLNDAELAVTVDPIDGTLNFVSGLPLFGTMAAVIMRGETVAAAIHDPIGGDTALALKGQGAWLQRLDGTRTDLRAAEPDAVSAMVGMASWRYLAEPLRSQVAARLPRTGDASSYRCCAHEYRLAAAGRCHYLLYGKLMPWDHAPGTLLLQEAGGYCALFDGSPYRPGESAGGILCAPDRASWEALRDALLAP